MEAYIAGRKNIGDHKMKSTKLLFEGAISECG